MYGQIGGSSARSYDAPPEAKREVEVSCAAGDMEYNLSELESVLGQLAGRLHTVLNGNAVLTGSSVPSTGYSCELAQRISSAGERIRLLRTGAAELLSRLEI